MDTRFLLSRYGGSQAQICRALNLPKTTVNGWFRRGGIVPDEALGRIARLYPELLRAWWREQSSAPTVALAQSKKHVRRSGQ